jgi:hypothetical protein
VSAADVFDAASTILEATGRSDLAGAIAWIAEDHPLAAGTNWTRLLRALLEVGGPKVDPEALRRVTREVASSKLDTSRVLFAADEIPTAATFTAATKALLKYSDDGTFGGLTARGVLRAQEANPHAVEALCLAVGVPEAYARGWFGSSGAWTEGRLESLLEYLDKLVRGKVKSPIGTIPARAPELMAKGRSRWRTIDDLNDSGVSYGMLLAQRAVDGPWLAHKNKTSRWPSRAAANEVGARLGERGIDFHRSTEIGGGVMQKDLQALSGIDDKRVGVVTLSKTGVPTFAVTFSAARDGGTARANGDGLQRIPRTPLPHALVLIGLGWSRRKETADLALKFGGLLFSERSIDDLVERIAEVTT